MRRLQLRSLSIPALALLLFAGNVSAQDKPAAPLSTLEVQQLIAHAQPSDHARLSVHFTTLETQYQAEAKRHTAMSQGFVGNPSRNLGTGMSAHCTRLVTLNTQSAAAARELATYHRTEAAGAQPTPLSPAARVTANAGVTDPTDEQLTALAAKAGTPADHRALEGYFLALAKRHTDAAKDHTAMAQAYRTVPTKGGAVAAALHCDRLATLSKESAKEATDAAAMHKKLENAVR